MKQTRTLANSFNVINSSETDFKDFTNFYKKCAAKPYSFLVIGYTLSSENPLHVRQNVIKNIKTNHEN